MTQLLAVDQEVASLEDPPFISDVADGVATSVGVVALGITSQLPSQISPTGQQQGEPLSPVVQYWEVKQPPCSSGQQKESSGMQ